jgi:hypothetical protein
MARRKIALIGNSGSGRSSCVRLVGGDLSVAEMDRHFDTRVSPPYEQALAWMLDRTPGQDVLDTSTHLKMLGDMADAKRRGRHAELFEQVLFVYLINADPDKRKQFLERPNARGSMRSPDQVQLSLRFHAAVDGCCRDLADVTVNTSRMSMEEVAALVAGVRDAVLGRS